MLHIVIVFISVLAVSPAAATSSPCSGKKGGISHCLGAIFVCNDNSASSSKQDCRTYEGGIHNKESADPPASEKAKGK